MPSIRDDWEVSVLRAAEYRGQRHLALAITQLESNMIATRTEARQIFGEWLEFFQRGPSPIAWLSFRSRVPQELLDSLSGQTQLELLHLKWGPYSDLSALRGMEHLTSLSLGGAVKVSDLQPLTFLSKLKVFALDQAHSVGDLSPLSQLIGLTSLHYGNGYPGSDKRVRIDNLEWIRPLVGLEELRLPGSVLAASELSTLLELPNLRELTIPLRQKYRDRVFEYAAHSPAFAGVARAYEPYFAKQ